VTTTINFGKVPDVPRAALDAWCQRWLGSGVEEVLFTTGHLSRVTGMHLGDGREVVVKVRPAAERLLGCTDVHQALWRAGFPCPQPLVGPLPLGAYAANAESLMANGDLLGPADGAVECYAELLAQFIRLAPNPSSTWSLTPNPAWVDWDHECDGVWPMPDDRDDDLNAHPEPAWLDEVGRRVRDRLRRTRGEPVVIGHGDWEGQNIRWHGKQAWAVHDWDSVMTGPEPVVVGLAAAVWPCGPESRAASIDESEAFIEAYQRAAGRRWTVDEVEASWAAGLWVYAFNTKKSGLYDVPWLDPDEAGERLRRAGAVTRC
jgi:hypothetical protein